METDTQRSQNKFAPDPARPLEMLQNCPVYKASPLHRLSSDVGTVLVKDERQRMGLGAFKGLGGVYAVGTLILQQWQRQYGEALAPAELTSDSAQDFASGLTFVCASAGNHGLAVAAGAQLFGAKARVHLPESAPVEYVRRLANKGASVVRSGLHYEASMAAAIVDAEETSAILLADSSWAGYCEIPCVVMEGYTVIAEELRLSFEQDGLWPTHVFLQAGVGGLAAAMVYMIRANWLYQPTIIIVEPDAAPCLQQSSAEGRIVTSKGPISTMGRLDCKVPSQIAFAVLEASDVQYCQVSDHAARDAVEALEVSGYPTTPSGAAGYAGLLRWHRENHDGPDLQPLIILSEAAL